MKKTRFLTRLIIGFTMLLIFSVVIGVLSIFQIKSISSNTEQLYKHPFTVNSSVKDISININAIHRSMKDVVLAENMEELNNYVKLVKYNDSIIHSSFDIIRDRFLGDKNIIEDAHKSYVSWEEIRNEVIQLKKEGYHFEAGKITKGKGAIHVELLLEKIKKLTDFAQNKADEYFDKTKKESNKNITMLLLTTAVLLILGVILTIFISKSISQPIRKFIDDVNLIYNKNNANKNDYYAKSEQEILSNTAFELKTAYEKLEKFNVELEQKVAERTLELKEQNKEYAYLNEELKLAKVKAELDGERLNFVLDGSNLGFWDWNIETNEVERNNRWAEMLGYSLEEIEFNVNQWTGLIYKEDREKALISLNNHLSGKTVFHKVEYRMVCKDNQLKWILDCAKIVKRDKNGKPIRMSGTHTDISESKNAEMELFLAKEKIEESELNFRTMFNEAPLGIGLVNSYSGRILKANPKYSSILGISVEELNAIDWMSVTHPDDIQPDIDNMALLNAGKIKGYQMEKRYIHKNKNIVWVNLIVTPMQMEENQDPYHLCMVEDITKRKRVEQQFIRAQEKLNLALQGGEIGVWEWDFDTDQTVWDAKMENMFGLQEGEFKQTFKAFKECLHPDDIVATTKAIKNAVAGIEPYDTIYRVVLKNKEIRFIQAKALIVKNENDYPIKMIGICSDITNQKQMESELVSAKIKAEESDRLKSAFLANMSHEIRTPMNGILGFAELLKKPNISGEEQQKFIKIIEKSGIRMLNIINDIVDISKIEAGLMEVGIMESNINEQIEYIYTFFKPEVEAKGMKLHFKNSLVNKEAVIKTDREKLFAILTNLVKNAIKYSEKGTIEFGYVLKINDEATIESQNNELEFFVKDSGHGIPKERQKAIFERFIQADVINDQAIQGAGLGLSITKAYVEILGGKIWVESQVGVGSTFYFTLPYNVKVKKNNNTEKIEFPAKAGNKVKNLNVLIAEDDETSEILLNLNVSEFSNKIINARTGPETVEICRNNTDIDLILLDIQLPYLNGYNAAREIRQFNKNVIIIAQTAYGLSGDREKSLNAGCNDYITKPVKKEKLDMLIQKYFN